MAETITPPPLPDLAAHGEVGEYDLRSLIEHATHVLPSQGPITVFVHHNTLHAFEELSFADALRQATKVYGCEPYLSEGRYRQELARGRIRDEDLAAVLQHDLGERADELIGMLGTRFHLRQAMLRYPLRTAPSAELRWVVAETDALRKLRRDADPEVQERLVENTRRWIMRDFSSAGPKSATQGVSAPLLQTIAELFESFDGSSIEHWSDETWEAFTLQLLWRICYRGVDQDRHAARRLRASARHRDVLLDATGHDSDELVHDILVRFCAAFLDQGFAHWPLPDRDAGFYQSFIDIYGEPGGVTPRWLRGLRAELQRLKREAISPLESIQESLDLLGVDAEHHADFITPTLLALRGWAGMIWQMETNAEWAVRPAPHGTLVEFLAIRLVLDRFASASTAREHLAFHGDLKDVRATALKHPSRRAATGTTQRAFIAFQLAQSLGWSPHALSELPVETWRALVDEIDAFSELERRRAFHFAYERRYRNQALDALTVHAKHRHEARGALKNAAVPSFQLSCCIDDREESFRRHLEEVDPQCETFAYAGFYGVAMYYRGAGDAHARPLCPVVIKPRHYVEEQPVYTLEKSHLRRAKTRRLLGAASHEVHRGSRSLLGGVVTAIFGSLASIPLVARILLPRTAAQIRRVFGRFVQPPPLTQLVLERSQPEPGPLDGHVGYSLDEMVGVVERSLRDFGLTSGFARLVILCGHGSASLNNPHESAYNCGACSGGRGGPNARAFSQMANDRRVRNRLIDRGLRIPDDTHFLGAFHNTCTDALEMFDLERLPPSHRGDYSRARTTIDEARRRNAHERCRRFESIELSASPDVALHHVEGRAEDLSQARPEYNHATNAMCFTGRRSTCRGLFMDRRAFLASYDPAQDDAMGSTLAGVLAAVIPVCAGISLEYYFSCVDPQGYGSGSKLPHNIASLLGVMEGASGDLRPGLSLQMIEIHEPMRCLFVIETTPEIMNRIMEVNSTIGRLCRNDWVQLAVMSPETGDVQLYRDGRFEPYVPETVELPQVASSIDWYRGWRDHLGFTAIDDPQIANHDRAGNMFVKRQTP